MADLKLFPLKDPSTCSQCATPIELGYAVNADVANSGGALCGKCAGVEVDAPKPKPTGKG